MNELQVKVIQTPGRIDANFEEIEAALKVQMQAYAELEVTEDNLTERKADVATLRKIREAVETERKRVKKDFDAPLKEFEAKVKNITGILDTEINRIVQEMDVFEQKRRAEKRQHIEDLYKAHIGEYAEYLPLAAIWSSRWENKTCKDSDIIFDISEKVTRVKSDLEVIRGLQSEIEDKLIHEYKVSGNQLSVAIRKNTDYLDAKRAAEERVRAEEERRAREKAEAEKRAAEEAQRAAEEVARKNASEQQWEDVEQIPVVDTHTGETVGSVVFPMNDPEIVVRVRGEENIEALRTFLDMSGIEYEEVSGC